MSSGVIPIGNLQLALASGFLLAAGIVSWRLALGEGKRIAIAGARGFLQLLAMGFLLVYLFRYQSWWLVLLVVLGMIAAATQIALDRVRHAVPGLAPDVFASILVTSVAITFIVVDGIIGPDPWYSARQFVPIAGMVIGNTMSAVAVAIGRLFSDLDAREEEIHTMVSLGATPREAAFPSIKAAVGAGLTGPLATLSAAGLVQIPGMMTGQILAGADPVMAAKYQVVVLLMLTAATAVSVVTVCYLTYRKRFSDEGYYLGRALRD
ncbi:iron export ABC transporter permease subunit FetB [Olsenella sp. YH-ols2217]|uniref:Iron export ABC transporter permease subunit FetB n=1 Tax=Kribbibacterium absianum TaxID=3044210 RepID=A0ABT6ZHY4_9ACTN|nr:MULTISPECIES: iron export ABC transporter permease subunit FetB [unclassified Olsenella]MDJ1121170.1 iron export ABC transporter permease subunit FetB [Olsenella sp. YH-ols2216]MDJ1128661.1 iron export ABC transporter permease subunit FetB [Olsenella sp. YH-ols2217]